MFIYKHSSNLEGGMKIQPGFHISLLLHFFWSLKKMKSSFENFSKLDFIFENPTSYQTVNCFLVQS